MALLAQRGWVITGGDMVPRATPLLVQEAGTGLRLSLTLSTVKEAYLVRV